MKVRDEELLEESLVEYLVFLNHVCTVAVFDGRLPAFIGLRHSPEKDYVVFLHMRLSCRGNPFHSMWY